MVSLNRNVERHVHTDLFVSHDLGLTLDVRLFVSFLWFVVVSALLATAVSWLHLAWELGAKLLVSFRPALEVRLVCFDLDDGPHLFHLAHDLDAQNHDDEDTEYVGPEVLYLELEARELGVVVHLLSSVLNSNQRRDVDGVQDVHELVFHRLRLFLFLDINLLKRCVFILRNSNGSFRLIFTWCWRDL